MNHEQVARELLDTVTIVEYPKDNGTMTYEARLGGNDPISGATVQANSREVAVRRMAEIVVLHVYNRITCPHCRQMVDNVDKLLGRKQQPTPSITQEREA